MDKFKRLILYLFIFFAVITIGSILFSHMKNCRLNQNFRKNEKFDFYDKVIENGEIDLLDISSLFTDITAPIGHREYKENIVSPITISYYENINDAHPCYVIEKGDIIHFKVGNRTRSGITYHGSESLPTAISGWRLSKPFVIEGKEENELLLYVKLEELECVSRKWIDENSEATNAIRNAVIRMGELPTKSNMSRQLLLFIDHKLYSEGVFLSKDLISPMFSNVVFMAGFTSIAFLTIYILLKCKGADKSF